MHNSVYKYFHASRKIKEKIIKELLKYLKIEKFDTSKKIYVLLILINWSIIWTKYVNIETKLIFGTGFTHFSTKSIISYLHIWHAYYS